MKIDLGEFGNQVVRLAESPRVQPGAFVTGDGLEKAGQALVAYADKLEERQAVSEATTQIFDGRRTLDKLILDLQSTPLNEADGKPSADGVHDIKVPSAHEVVSAFDRDSAAMIKALTSNAQTGLGRAAIQKDLLQYANTLRTKVAEIGMKQENDRFLARGMENMEKAVKAHDETALKQVIAGLVTTGVMTSVEGQKELVKRTEEIEYGRAYNRVQSAQTPIQMAEERGRLLTYNAKLRPEQNAALLGLANARLKELEDRDEKAYVKSQEEALRALTDAHRVGTLTEDMVRNFRPLLKPSDYDGWMARTDQTTRRQYQDVIDDPAVLREVDKEIADSWLDAKKLHKLRAQVADLGYGYDPATGVTGAPSLNRGTVDRLNNKIEGYLRQIEVDKKQQTGDAKQGQDRDFNDTRQLLDKTYDAYIKAQIGAENIKKAEQAHLRALEELQNNRSNAKKWFETHRKENEAVFNPKPALPSWVATKPDGTVDVDATKKRLLDTKSSLGDKEYQRRFDQLKTLGGR